MKKLQKIHYLLKLFRIYEKIGVEMKKRTKAGLIGFLLGIFCTGFGGMIILEQYYGIHLMNDSGLLTKNVLRKAATVEAIIDKENLEKPDKKMMEEGIYAGMVASLQDPYAYYMTADNYKGFLESTTGSYKGIGVIMMGQLVDNKIKVDGCYPGTPGEKAGILSGDFIIEMDGKSLEGVQPHEFGLMVRNREEGEMTLGILREGKKMEVHMTPEEIVIPTLEYEMLEKQLGYIKISEFTEGTSQQFQEAYGQLQKDAMKGFIVDLRNNPGGLLTGVCDTLEQILPEGLIVYTEDKNGSRREIKCEGKTPICIPFIVLINGESASASEIFAGAVKDHQIGMLVGEKTFGKGIVQSTFNIKDGSAVKLTTSKYFTPAGNNIHGKGIEPDVIVPMEEGETDKQLETAIELLETQIK